MESASGLCGVGNSAPGPAGSFLSIAGVEAGCRDAGPSSFPTWVLAQHSPPCKGGVRTGIPDLGSDGHL